MTLGVTETPLETDGLRLDSGAFVKEDRYIALVGATHASYQDGTIIGSDKPSAAEIWIKD